VYHTSYLRDQTSSEYLIIYGKPTRPHHNTDRLIGQKSVSRYWEAEEMLVTRFLQEGGVQGEWWGRMVVGPGREAMEG